MNLGFKCGHNEYFKKLITQISTCPISRKYTIFLLEFLLFFEFFQNFSDLHWLGSSVASISKMGVGRVIMHLYICMWGRHTRVCSAHHCYCTSLPHDRMLKTSLKLFNRSYRFTVDPDACAGHHSASGKDLPVLSSVRMFHGPLWLSTQYYNY